MNTEEEIERLRREISVLDEKVKMLEEILRAARRSLLILAKAIDPDLELPNER